MVYLKAYKTGHKNTIEWRIYYLNSVNGPRMVVTALENG